MEFRTVPRIGLGESLDQAMGLRVEESCSGMEAVESLQLFTHSCLPLIYDKKWATSSEVGRALLLVMIDWALGVKGSSAHAMQQRLIAGAFREKLHVKLFLRDEAFVN